MSGKALPMVRQPAVRKDARTLDDECVREIATRLRQAEVTRAPVRQLSLEYPRMTIEDAYAVQHAGVGLKLAEGRRLLGRKIGLTSRTMQQAVSIDEPDYGALYDDMFFEDGTEVPYGRFIKPRVEVELAFVLGDSLKGPGCTKFDVLRAAEYVTPALEILDARVQMTDPETGHIRTIVDTIADNAADAGLVLGGRVVRPMDIDLRWVSALLYRNGVIEESGVAAAVLNHPANGVAWLANKLAPHGVSLEPGQVILAGSFTRPVHACDGDTFHADFGPLGNITCRFTGEAPDVRG
ncbi:2-oxo-hept-4-ene-1,7-dioate hydratase [Streptomyces phaeochromogenes]|uniref:2-oxo-hept-4-ene-1,7-dioate hydratase n=1 Tax=Streptomyces phaeochromogenes TaxID=1923 RepID=UPI00368F4A70